MNKILVSAIMISLAIMASGALALEPCPLAFNFQTSPVGAAAGLNVQISYLNNVVASGTTNEYGEIVFDLGDKGIPNCLSQSFELTVPACADTASCNQVVSFNPNGYTTIDIKDANLFTPPAECFTRDQCQAFCPTCPECSTCPTFNTDTECTSAGWIKPEECPVQPDTTLQTAIIAIVTLIAGLGIGKYGLGVKIYTNTKGEVVKQHKHKNVVGYHSADIMHRIEPHKKGELTPNYSNEKDEKGKYKYVG